MNALRICQDLPKSKVIKANQSFKCCPQKPHLQTFVAYVKLFISFHFIFMYLFSFFEFYYVFFVFVFFLCFVFGLFFVFIFLCLNTYENCCC